MCGVFGVRAPERDVARLSYFGLYALQHRGQESAGIAAADRGGYIITQRALGLVNQVFKEHDLRALAGDLAIGHVRYSTTGANEWENSQPVHRSAGCVEMSAAMISESEVEVNCTPSARSSAWSSTALMRLPLWASAISRRLPPPAPAERWTGWEFSHSLDPVVE